MSDFVTSWIKHLENTGSLSCTDLPNVAHFVEISQITYVNIPTNLIRKTHHVMLTEVLIKFSTVPICT